MRASHYALTTVALVLPWLSPAAAAQTCDAYFTRSQSLSALVTEAYASMKPLNPTAMANVLPKIEAELNKLSSAEIKAEVCSGNHINAYTDHQYAELSALRAHGADTGFPAKLPLVKQPDLNQASLAYAVGWIKYEQGNFDGALAAYSKGLGMFPHNAELQNEYLASLMQLKRYDDLLEYSDKVITESFLVKDATLGKIYAARGVAQAAKEDFKSAEESFRVSLLYDNTEDTRSLQEQVKDLMAAKKN
jgi:tetratricopeptide (TPR) repeat protein